MSGRQYKINALSTVAEEGPAMSVWTKKIHPVFFNMPAFLSHPNSNDLLLFSLTVFPLFSTFLRNSHKTTVDGQIPSILSIIYVPIYNPKRILSYNIVYSVYVNSL